MKKYIFITITILFILNIYLACRYYFLFIDNNIKTNQLEASINNLSILEEIYWIQFYDSGKQISSNILLEDSDGDTVKLGQISSDNVTFVFIPHGECGSCIENMVDQVKESLFHEESKTIFLSSFYSSTEHKNMEYLLEIKILNLRGVVLGTLFERRNIFSVYKLSEDMKIIHLYLPNRPESVYKNRYYKALKNG